MRARVRITGTALTAAIALAACASTGERQEGAVPGCYYFQQDPAAEELNLPWGVRLKEADLQGWPAMERRGGAREAATLTGRGEADHPFGYWMTTASDSVEIGYPAGGGFVLKLAVGEELDLRGVAIPVGDMVNPNDPSPREQHAVLLTRARCP